MNTALWVLFLGLQVFGAGNINYQQEAGYYEMNPIYGRHPSKTKVYAIKAIETGLIYGITKGIDHYEFGEKAKVMAKKKNISEAKAERIIKEKYKNMVLGGAISIQLGCIGYDKFHQGISMKVRF